MPKPNFASGASRPGTTRIHGGMNSACVDLVYLDPPFKSNRHYKAPSAAKPPGPPSRMPGPWMRGRVRARGTGGSEPGRNHRHWSLENTEIQTVTAAATKEMT